jgi:uncharacterized protein (DUF697 family)
MWEIEMSEGVAEGPAPSNGNTPIDAAARGLRVARIGRNHILASMGVGLVPIPLVDIVGVLGINLDMIKKLSAEYEIPFHRDRGKAILTSLLSGLFPVAVGGPVISLLKCVPLIGQTAGAVAFPVLAGATTYAVHNVFVQHYEAGGTILDFSPARLRKRFSECFCEGKNVAADLHKNDPAAAA